VWSVEFQQTFRRHISPPSSGSVETQRTTRRHIPEDDTLLYATVHTITAKFVPSSECFIPENTNWYHGSTIIQDDSFKGSPKLTIINHVILH
jgi:hypothetical protein